MKRTAIRNTALAVLMGLSIGLAPRQADAQTRPFEAIRIGAVRSLGGISNTAPVVAVGQHRAANLQNRAFSFVEGDTIPRTLPLVPGDANNDVATALGISDDSGDAVGASDSNPTVWPVPANAPVSNPGNFPSPQGCFSTAAAAINDNRVAVGTCQAFSDAGSNRPARWTITTQFGAEVLPTANIPGFSIPQSGSALDINNSGIIVGEQGGKAAVWLSPTQPPLVLNTLQQVRGISNGSLLVENGDFITATGMISTPAGNQSRAVTFLMVNGAPAFLGIARLPFTYYGNIYPMSYQYLIQPFIGADVKKINNAGSSVGAMVERTGGRRAAIWSLNGSFADLTAQTSGLPAGAVLTEALDINNQGYVLAQAMVNGQLTGFLLRPTGVTIPFTFGPIFY